MQSKCDNTTKTTASDSSTSCITSQNEASTIGAITNTKLLIKRHSNDIKEWLRAIQFYPEIEQSNTLIEHKYLRDKLSCVPIAVPAATIQLSDTDVCIRRKSGDKYDRQVKCIYVENPNFPYLQLSNTDTTEISGEEIKTNASATSISTSTSSSSVDTCTFLLSDVDCINESHEQLNNLNIRRKNSNCTRNTPHNTLNIQDTNTLTNDFVQQCKLCGEQIERIRLKFKRRYSYPPLLFNEQTFPQQSIVDYDYRFLNHIKKIDKNVSCNVTTSYHDETDLNYCLKCLQCTTVFSEFVQKMKINRIFDNGKKRQIPKPPIRRKRLRQRHSVSVTFGARHTRRQSSFDHSDSESDETDAQNEFICRWFVNHAKPENQQLNSIAESSTHDSNAYDDAIYQNTSEINLNLPPNTHKKDSTHSVYQNLDFLSSKHRVSRSQSFNDNDTTIYQNVTALKCDSVPSNPSESIYENIWELKSHSLTKTQHSSIKYEKFENDSNTTSSTNSLLSYDKSHDLHPPDYDEFHQSIDNIDEPQQPVVDIVKNNNQLKKIENKRRAIDFEYFNDEHITKTSSNENVCIYENLLGKSEQNLSFCSDRSSSRHQSAGANARQSTRVAGTPMFTSKFNTPLPSLCTAEEIHFTFESVTPIYDSILLTPSKLKQLSNRAHISTHIYRLTADIHKWKIDLYWKYCMEPEDIMEDKSLENIVERLDDTSSIQFRRLDLTATSSTSAKSRHQSLLPGQSASLWPNDPSTIKKQGKFYRTKIIDCARKQKKWVQNTYGCLMDDSFRLFETENDFQQWQQNPSENAKMMIEMDLSCCELRKKSDHTSTRKNVLVLVNTDNKSEILIHFENEKEHKLWQDIFQPAIHLAMTPKMSARLQASLLESPVDDKPAPPSPSKEQRKIKDKLRTFFGRRPSVDDLRKTGIYKDEPIFGSDLETICKNMRRPKVPKFVCACIEAIEPYLDVEGLYRASGNIAHIQRIRLEVDQNQYSSIDATKVDIHVLTGALKLFFRELTVSLIPPSKYESFSALLDGDVDVNALRDIIRSFPHAHFDTLQHLLGHLHKVAENEKCNRMDVTNLSTVWAPNLLQIEFSTKDQNNLYVQCSLQRKLICVLLENYFAIFK